MVQVGAAGVNPVDTYIRSGTNNYSANFPHTPGSDGAGTIAELGANVVGFEVGQRVYFSRNLTGSSAEFAAAHQPTRFRWLMLCLSKKALVSVFLAATA